jgi:hypothetical protein
MIRVALVSITDARTQWVMALLLSIGSCFCLCLEGTTYSLATGKLEYVVCDRGSFWTSLGSWFNVDICHRHVPFLK